MRRRPRRQTKAGALDANDHNAQEVVDFLGSLPFKFKRELVTVIREEADLLKSAIKDAAPRGGTGNLAESVQVKRGRHSLELVITAGGDLTTKGLNRNVRYEREVKIGQGDTQGIARDPTGKGVTYDYSLAAEFGTSKMAARPFFYATYRARKLEIDERIQAKLDNIVERAIG